MLYKHAWCNNDDGCKLTKRPTTGPTCNWNLITSDNVDSPTVVYAQLPKHSCSSKNRYYNRLDTEQSIVISIFRTARMFWRLSIDNGWTIHIIRCNQVPITGWSSCWSLGKFATIIIVILTLPLPESA